MRLLVALSCLLAAVLAQKPHPCASPPLLSGAFTAATQNEKLWVYSKYLYDSLGRRQRLMEIGTYQNRTFTYDVLALFNEGVAFEINYHNQTCRKRKVETDFHPMEVPKDATLLGQAIVGSSSGPGQGLLVNTWTGDMPKSGQYFTTVTEFGCIPVSFTYKMKEYGWVVVSLFDNVIGIVDPGLLNPPAFCPSLEAEFDYDDEPVDFFSHYLRRL